MGVVKFLGRTRGRGMLTETEGLTDAEVRKGSWRLQRGRWQRPLMTRTEALHDSSEQGRVTLSFRWRAGDQGLWKKQGISPREQDWILTGPPEAVTLENRRQKPSGQPCARGPLKVELTLLPLAALPALLRWM